jgi:hypothetical protein
MNDQAVRDHLASTYLETLQALAYEITVAINAISANELVRFRDSVAQQEMLCAVLATMASTMKDNIGSSGMTDPPFSDATVEEKIRDTTRAICQLNLQYGALLTHSGRSIALLASLCRSHTGQVLESNGTRSKHQTWSCEI